MKTKEKTIALRRARMNKVQRVSFSYSDYGIVLFRKNIAQGSEFPIAAV